MFIEHSDCIHHTINERDTLQSVRYSIYAIMIKIRVRVILLSFGLYIQSITLINRSVGFQAIEHITDRLCLYTVLAN